MSIDISQLNSVDFKKFNNINDLVLIANISDCGKICFDVKNFVDLFRYVRFFKFGKKVLVVFSKKESDVNIANFINIKPEPYENKNRDNDDIITNGRISEPITHQCPASDGDNLHLGVRCILLDGYDYSADEDYDSDDGCMYDHFKTYPERFKVWSPYKTGPPLKAVQFCDIPLNTYITINSQILLDFTYMSPVIFDYFGKFSIYLICSICPLSKKDISLIDNF
jgi:hypothetical protein